MFRKYDLRCDVLMRYGLYIVAFIYWGRCSHCVSCVARNFDAYFSSMEQGSSVSVVTII
jgi:hypothetical protein